jgi:tRNA A37 N6-isopentenylltransferase MiaA
MPEDRQPLVIVAGATASGKTAVAIQMARLLGELTRDTSRR